MMDFECAVEILLEWEGGVASNSKDSGGFTKFGISKKAYPDLDIANLTREDAIEIYHRDYWRPCRCDALPEYARLLVFNSAVNQGVKTAINILQVTLNVPMDGKVGPETIKAFARQGSHEFIVDYAAHLAYQYGNTMKFKIFGLGWLRRLVDMTLKA